MEGYLAAFLWGVVVGIIYARGMLTGKWRLWP